MEPAKIRPPATRQPAPQLLCQSIVQELVESSPEAIFLETLTGEILDCNCAACQIFGYAEKAELVTRQIKDIFPEKVAVTFPAVVTEELTTGGILVEAWGKRKDGSLFPTQVSTRLINYEGEQLVIAHIRDITVEKELEERRAVRQELTAALSTAAVSVNSRLQPDEVLDCILEQVARVVNGEAFNVMLINADSVRIVRWRGYDKLELGIKVSTEPMPLDKYPSLIKMLRTSAPVVIPDTLADPHWVGQEKEWRRSYIGAPILIGEEPVGFLNVNSTEPGRFGAEDGQRLQIFAIQAGTAIHNARLHQQLHQYAKNLEQRVAERTAELATQNARLETILRSVTDGIVVIDPAGTVLLANPLAEKWNAEFLPSADAQKLREAMRTLAREAGGALALTLELSTADLQLQAVPVLAAEGGESQVVITIHDVSELKTLERLKSQFISSISHELRTPLTAIKLYAQLLQYKNPNKEDEYLAALNSEIDYLVEMVERILQFSKISVHQITLKLEPTDLNVLLEAIIKSRQAFAKQKALSFTFHPNLGLPKIRLDQEQIRHVFLNLISNALHYTPAGGVVQVSTEITVDNGQEWVITEIKDTGMGIPHQELPHIFKRFYRGAEPRREQISGSGLGLAITKELVEVHNGWITVESKENHGSIFTVWLPVNRGPVLNQV